MAELRTGAGLDRVACHLRSAIRVVALLLVTAPLAAQDLDPRAYAHVPVNGTFLVTGFSCRMARS